MKTMQVRLYGPPAGLLPSPSTLRWLWRGAVRGMGAGCFLWLYQTVAALLLGRDPLSPLRWAATLPLGATALSPRWIGDGTAAWDGLLVYAILSMLYGAFFAGLVETQPSWFVGRRRLLLGATLYGLALWVVNYLVLAPAAAMPWFAGPPALVQAAGHALVFGTGLGALMIPARREA